jgi:hypothetical protein
MVQGVHVRFEWSCRCAAGNLLQKRRFNFDEVAFPQEVANFSQQCAARKCPFSRFSVCDEVKVPLALKLFAVR